MSIDIIETLRQRFVAYTDGFSSDNPEDRRNILLKVEHTFSVSSHCREIASGESFSGHDVLLAGVVGLFHDIGRFPQYARYHTFRDSESVNHGKLGAEILSESDILDLLSGPDRAVVLDAVRFHNAYTIPALENERALLFLRLLRDADKLDIWRVFAEYFDTPPEERASAAGLGLPDLPVYSDSILACLSGGMVASVSELRTLNDFRIAQLSWVYDLNFRTTFRLLMREGHLMRIAAGLPGTDAVRAATDGLKRYIISVAERTGGDGSGSTRSVDNSWGTH